MTTPSFEVASRIIQAEYQRLCNFFGLIPVPLDVYICDTENTQDFTALGFPIAQGAAAYSGTRRLMAVPLAPGDPLPSTIPDFPPRVWNTRSDEWPTWRLDVWHEVVHQVSNDILKAWDLKEPGRSRERGRSDPGHGVGWFQGIQHVAAHFSVDADALDLLLDQ